jgi:hypothetical protein
MAPTRRRPAPAARRGLPWRPGRLAIALGLAALLTSAARADQIIQQHGFTNRKTDFTDGTTLTFNQFDTLGGKRQLLSVELVIEQTLRTSLFIEAPPTGATITAEVGTAADPPTLTTNSPFGLLLDPPDPGSDKLVSQLSPVTVVWAWTQGADYSNSWTTSASRSIAFADAGTLALFSGGGTFSMLTGGSSSFRYSSDTGSGMAINMTTADVSARLVYNFRVVPEPASLALVGTGAGVLLLAGLRRRRSRARPA